jgi:hypothetical protein
MNTLDRNGSAGGTLISSTTGALVGVAFSCVEILEDGTTFSVWTNKRYNGNPLTGRTWKRGDRIWGLTTALTCTAGEAHAIDQA